MDVLEKINYSDHETETCQGRLEYLRQFRQIVHFVKLSQSEWDQMLMVYLAMASWKELYHEFVDRGMRD